MISSSIVDYYYTQLMGDPNNMPVIKALRYFRPNTLGLLDGDQYTSTGALKFGSTNVFFRSVRNMVFDTTEVPGTVYAVHWPSSQATSIQNCVFKLSQAPGTHHTGLFIEEGSGGFLNDLVFYGGEYGAQLGNQQYTMRNLTFFNCKTAIMQIWDWGWTYKSINVYNSGTGINMTGPIIGGVTLLDSTFSNTETAIATRRAPASQKSNPGAGSLIIENVVFNNVQNAVTGPAGAIIRGNPGLNVKKGFAYVSNFVPVQATFVKTYNGGANVIIQGNLYSPTGPTVYQASDDASFPKTPKLLSGGKFYERSKVRIVRIPSLSRICDQPTGRGKALLPFARPLETTNPRLT